jgi:hypothetical protein
MRDKIPGLKIETWGTRRPLVVVPSHHPTEKVAKMGREDWLVRKG